MGAARRSGDAPQVISAAEVLFDAEADNLAQMLDESESSGQTFSEKKPVGHDEVHRNCPGLSPIPSVSGALILTAVHNEFLGGIRPTAVRVELPPSTPPPE